MTMLSTISNRVLARAPLSLHLLMSSVTSIMAVSSTDRNGSASLSTVAPTIQSNNGHVLLSKINKVHHPLKFFGLRHEPGAMFSSLSHVNRGWLSPKSHEESRSRKKFPIHQLIRTNFSYAGPRKLSDILKTELLDGKSSAEISDLWMTYHEGKENVHGLTLDQAKGKSLLSRAAQCPFFIQPVFREEGHFMIVSQFQAPNHFLLAFLEDYRMDPARAQPLLTVSVFDDMAEGKNVTLVRCDIVNRGIEDDEGYKICKCLLDDYINDDGFGNVHMFNKKPDAFDVDEFVKEKEPLWKEGGGGDNEEESVTGAAVEKKNDSTG